MEDFRPRIFYFPLRGLMGTVLLQSWNPPIPSDILMLPLSDRRCYTNQSWLIAVSVATNPPQPPHPPECSTIPQASNHRLTSY